MSYAARESARVTTRVRATTVLERGALRRKERTPKTSPCRRLQSTDCEGGGGGACPCVVSSLVLCREESPGTKPGRAGSTGSTGRPHCYNHL